MMALPPSSPAPHPRLADATTNELLAMLEVMFLVATADEHFSPQERKAFLEHAEALSGGRIDSGMLARLVDSWGKRDLDDLALRLREIARDLPDETSRRIAFGLAQGVADADGVAETVETRLLVQLAQAFDLSPAESEEIAHSVRMSSRPPRRHQ